MKKPTYEELEDCLAIALESLAMYADPDTYFGIAFIPDPPAGNFIYDFDLVENSDYDRPVAGKDAREAFEKIKGIFDDKYNDWLKEKNYLD